MNQTAFERGIAAAADGLPASANPYPEGAEDHASWDQGYHSVIDHPEDIKTDEEAEEA